MQEITIKIGDREYTLNNNSGKLDRAKKDAGKNAPPEQILAHYDKLAGLIKDESGNKVENGPFWEAEKKRIADEPRQLRYKTDEELREIMRNSIDNQYVPSSIYHKAKQELEFRNSQKQDDLMISQNQIIKPKWWEKTWVQIIMLLGAIAGIIGLYSLFS